MSLILGENITYYMINRLHFAESDGQGIRRIVWRSKVPYLIHEGLSLDPSPAEIHPVPYSYNLFKWHIITFPSVSV